MLYAHDKKASPLQKVDKVTILIFLLLALFGWICVVGASYTIGDEAIVNFTERSGKQLIWISCSLIIGLGLLLTDERYYDTFADIIYVLFLILLAATPFIATPHKGSYSWITMGPVSIQPAEFAKCATALFLSKTMGAYDFSFQNMRCRLRAISIVLLPMCLIIMQHETGSALVFLVFFLVFYREGMSGSFLFIGFAIIVYFVVGLRYEPFPLPNTLTSVGRFCVLLLTALFTIILLWIHTKDKNTSLYFCLATALTISLSLIFSTHILTIDVSITLAVLLGGFIIYMLILSLRKQEHTYVYIAIFTIGSMAINYSENYVLNNVMQAHQQPRIRVLLGLEEDINGVGYNVHQSQIAIGSGGLSGKGFLNGTQTKLKYVPEQDTDFIFCTVGEEHGFIGCSVVLLLFLTLILRLLFLAERQTHAFGRIYGYCVVCILLFHLFINIGMVIGLTPVIGIPLPFFSYGGSSLWGFTILLFIFLRIDANREK